jgi:hypothetical protein
MQNTYIIHTNSGTKIFSASQIIENAIEQQNAGITPRYRHKMANENVPSGFLVWSTVSGCGVVYFRHDGKPIITMGVQGDFICA